MNNGFQATQGVFQQIEVLELDLIVICNYQRPISQSRVDRIAAAFDPAKLGVLVVNRRNDGSYAILDGQHRLSALRSMGIKHGPAIVLEGMTMQQEADYFRRQNENSTTLNCYDLYNAGLVALDPHFLQIERILRFYGFKASRRSGPGLVTAVSALTRIVKMFGFDVLDMVFAYIAATWPTDSTMVRREMLAGLADFAARFGKSVDPQRFANRMRTKHPSEMFYEYKRRTEGRVTSRNAFSRPMRYTLCAILVAAHNTGLHSSSRARLKLEWDMPGQESESKGGVLN